MTAFHGLTHLDLQYSKSWPMNPKFTLSFHGSGIRFVYETQQFEQPLYLYHDCTSTFPAKTHAGCPSHLLVLVASTCSTHSLSYYGVRNPDKLCRGFHQSLTRGECHVKLTRHHAKNAGNLKKNLNTHTHIYICMCVCVCVEVAEVRAPESYCKWVTLTLCKPQYRSALNGDSNCQIVTVKLTRPSS
jgi:hypothetical protein